MGDWLSAERRAILKRLEKLPDCSDGVRARARRRLISRLDHWYGSSTPSDRVIADDVITTKTVSGDPAELMIARAISTTLDPASFGVSRSGAAYTTKRRSVSSAGEFHSFIGGLSPLLDGAAILVGSAKGKREDRFFERKGRFFTAGGGTLFEFRLPPAAPLWRRALSAVQFWHSESLSAQGCNIFAPQPWPKPADVEADVVDTRTPKVIRQIHIDLPSPGVLQQMGYKVGRSGLPIDERRAILRTVLTAELFSTDESRSYVAEWGSPRSRQRFDKTTRCLSAFVDSARRRQGDYSVAIDDWTDDLEWLRETYQ